MTSNGKPGTHDVDEVQRANEDSNLTEDLKRKYDLLLTTVKDTYNNELERLNNFDSKANNLIGYISLILGVLIGFGTFQIHGEATKMQFYLPYFVGVGSMLFSIGFSLYASKITVGDFFLNTKYFMDTYTEEQYSSLQLTGTLIGTFNALTENIDVLNTKKAKYINLSWYFLMAGIIITVVAVSQS